MHIQIQKPSMRMIAVSVLLASVFARTASAADGAALKLDPPNGQGGAVLTKQSFTGACGTSAIAIRGFDVGADFRADGMLSFSDMDVGHSKLRLTSRSTGKTTDLSQTLWAQNSIGCMRSPHGPLLVVESACATMAGCTSTAHVSFVDTVTHKVTTRENVELQPDGTPLNETQLEALVTGE